MTRWSQADVDAVQRRGTYLQIARETKSRFSRKIQDEGIAMMRAGLNKADTRDRTPRKSRAKALPPDWDASLFGGFSFRLPWAPSVNSCYFNLAKKGRARTTRAREFESMAMAAMLEQNVPKNRISHQLAISITQYANSARGDIDNGLKIVLDCMKKYGVIADDNREIVRRITVEDGERAEVPWVSVHVSAVIR